MKTRIHMAAVLAALFLPLATRGAVDLSELLNPDDVMLRKPAASKVDPQKKDVASAEAKARAEAERLVAEKAAAERVAAEKAAAERAAAEKAAAEAKARAEAERLAAEKAAADAELKRLREQVAAEKAARERAEAEKAAAEKTATEAAVAAEKATAKAARAEKRAAYLANPDPDERPKQKLVVTGDAKDVTETVSDPDPVAAVTKPGMKKAKKELTGRAAVITADRTDYDRKEGVILFDRSVYVDDEQYQMHAERLFVFLDGTNDMKRLVALGNVALTNEDKTAWCQKAVYTKAASKIVLFGDEQNPAWLRDAGGKKGDESEVRGLRITYWIDSGLATVEKSVITLPGFGGSKNPKDLFNLGGDKRKKGE